MTGSSSGAIPWTSSGFWPRYWVTLRPYLCYVSGAAGWVGLSLAPDLGGWALAAATGAFFLAYGVGQALTDVFQTDTDALSAPYRPLPRGEISRSAVAGVSLSGLTFCAVVFGFLNPWTLAVSGLAVVGLTSYTPLKRRWWGGPIWNSAIMALLPWIGWLCGGGRPWEVIDEDRVLLAMGSVFGTYATFVVLGYLKDVDADRATGYETLPVRFGRRWTVAASVGFLVLGLACSWALIGPVWHSSRVGLTVWTLGVLALLVSHGQALAVERDVQAGPMLVVVVTGFVLLHFGEAGLARPGWAWGGAAAGVGAIWALRKRPATAQV